MNAQRWRATRVSGCCATRCLSLFWLALLHHNYATSSRLRLLARRCLARCASFVSLGLTLVACTTAHPSRLARAHRIAVSACLSG